MQSNWDGSVRAKKIYTIISSIVVVAAAAAAAAVDVDVIYEVMIVHAILLLPSRCDCCRRCRRR